MPRQLQRIQLCVPLEKKTPIAGEKFLRRDVRPEAGA